MKVTVLGSGSKGNSTLIEFKNKKILIDVGFSYKNLKERLEKVEVYPKEIDYIFITHDHSDHISGLKVFLNQNKPIVVVSEKIVNSIDYLKNYTKIHFVEDDFHDEEFEAIAVPTSHDAIDGKGYIISEDESIVILTDTGYINQRNFKYLSNREYYIFESNHDVDMLVKGKYPPHIQRRILSPKGHLSNKESSVYLSKLIGPKTKKVILAHLSEDNNSEEVALETFNNVMSANDITFLNVECAKQNELVKVND